jgi:hypothetical protein
MDCSWLVDLWRRGEDIGIALSVYFSLLVSTLALSLSTAASLIILIPAFLQQLNLRNNQLVFGATTL